MPQAYRDQRTTSRSWSPVTWASRRTCAVRACGRSTSGPGSASIRLAPAGATPISAKEARAADRRQAGTIRSRVQRFGDNVDTDAIIPGQFCHLTALPELGAKAFHFVRPDFVQKVREGAQVVVAGEGWGSGSSREQEIGRASC